MFTRTCFATCSLWAVLALSAPAAEQTLAVDRGLPQANLNNISGPGRSNVRWTWQDQGFLGDDFTVGVKGERWVIDTIRVWTVPGASGQDPEFLGDLYEDVRLYFGGAEGGLTPVSTGLLARRGNVTSNPSIRISEATAQGALPYDDFGNNLKIWQVDFTNLNLAVEGGARYRFGTWALGRAVPDNHGKTFAWFAHASHAALSAARQDGADGSMYLFDAAGRPEGTFTAEGSGWDKSADINVQVFAHRAEDRTQPATPAR